jgi:hypothetical protein
MLNHFSRGDNCVKTIDFINFIKVGLEIELGRYKNMPREQKL